jgi:hypothetical protein
MQAPAGLWHLDIVERFHCAIDCINLENVFSVVRCTVDATGVLIRLEI